MFSLLSVNGGNTTDWLVRVYHIWHTEVGKMSPQDSLQLEFSMWFRFYWSEKLWASPKVERGKRGWTQGICHIETDWRRGKMLLLLLTGGSFQTGSFSILGSILGRGSSPPSSLVLYYDFSCSQKLSLNCVFSPPSNRASHLISFCLNQLWFIIDNRILTHILFAPPRERMLIIVF